MDLKKLSLGDQIIGGSGIVLFIASFLTWFKVEVDGLGAFGASASANAWDLGFLVGPFPVLIGLLMVAYVAVRAFAPQVQLPEGVPYDLVLFIAGCVAAALVVLKLLIGEDDAGGLVDVSRGIGIFLGTLAALGLAAGGYMKWKMEPTTTSAPPTSF